MSAPRDDQVLDVCLRALSWARERRYAGTEKHDALNSRMLRAAFGWGKWPRILATQLVMRSPVNLRPVLGVKPHRNPKGLALFARARLNLHSVTGDPAHLAEARVLLDWLMENPSQGYSGRSWGYPYPWQDLGFFAPAGLPNRVVTYFVGRALIHGWERTGDPRYLQAAGQAVEFILNEPRVLFDRDGMKCVSYVPDPSIETAVMDVPALCGALCAMVGMHTGNKGLLAEAGKLMAWVADKQTGYGAWFYAHPATDSPITHDNYHTGEIVDAFLEYERYSGDSRFRKTYEDGLGYYRENLFTADARPKWMNDRTYPHDAHGYSQGIITFSMAGDRRFAGRVAQAALDDIWDGREGRFRYRRGRFAASAYTPMRWAQGWMAFALSQFLAQEKGHGTLSGRPQEVFANG